MVQFLKKTTALFFMRLSFKDIKARILRDKKTQYESFYHS